MMEWVDDDADTQEIAEDLQTAAEMCMDETGEWWSFLADSERCSSYGSEEFRAAFEKELRAEHKRLKTEFHYRETKKEETIIRTWCELLHESELPDAE